MRQELTTDTVERYIEAPPEVLYDFVSDVTRTPERTPDIVKCEWLCGATGPAVGARFKSINKQGRGPNWSNKPVVTVADAGQEFSFTRTEPFAGTILWRHRFVPEGTGTRMIESYEVIKPLTIVGWFIIDTLYGMKDRQSDLRGSMIASMDRLAELVEVDSTSASSDTSSGSGSPSL
jgi:ligand-binding SRPBCC domain-containing protein